MNSKKADKLEDETRYRILSQEELFGETGEGKVIDIGSGTGFFTDHIAEKAEKVYAVDFQEGLHKYYRDKGIPENVKLIHSKSSEIDLEADQIISILSLHEINLEESLEKFHEILPQNGELVIWDWSVNALTDDIPPRDKMYTAEEASNKVSEKFKVVLAEERRNTFKIKARK